MLAPRAPAAPPARPNVTFGAPGRAAYHPMAVTITVPGPLNRARFLAWADELPKELERAKGYFRFAGEPELQEFQYAPPGRATVTPVMLLDEPDPAVVLIGRGFDVDRWKERLLTCVEPDARA